MPCHNIFIVKPYHRIKSNNLNELVQFSKSILWARQWAFPSSLSEIKSCVHHWSQCFFVSKFWDVIVSVKDHVNKLQCISSLSPYFTFWIAFFSFFIQIEYGFFCIVLSFLPYVFVWCNSRVETNYPYPQNHLLFFEKLILIFKEIFKNFEDKVLKALKDKVKSFVQPCSLVCWKAREISVVWIFTAKSSIFCCIFKNLL